MKWADDSVNRGATVDFLVVILPDKDKFYYPCTIPDDVILTADEWFKVKDSLLKDHNIILEWIKDTKSSKEYLDERRYKRYD